MDLSERIDLLKGPNPAVLKLLDAMEDDDPLLPRWAYEPIDHKPKEFACSVHPREFGRPDYRLDPPIADDVAWAMRMLLQRPKEKSLFGIGARDAYQYAVGALTLRCIVDWEIPTWTFGLAWELRAAMQAPPIIKLTERIVATSWAPSYRSSPTAITTLQGLRFYVAWGTIRAITGA